MYNDTVNVNMTELIAYNEEKMKSTKRSLEEYLKGTEWYHPPKTTEHLEKMIQFHEQAIKELTNETTFIMSMHGFVRSEKDHETKISKEHIEKMITYIKNEEYNEARKYLYAFGYKAYICSLVLHDKKIDEQMELLVPIHQRIIKDLKKIIEKTRIRVIFN
jgi:hypothetical protein